MYCATLRVCTLLDLMVSLNIYVPFFKLQREFIAFFKTQHEPIAWWSYTNLTTIKTYIEMVHIYMVYIWVQFYWLFILSNYVTLEFCDLGNLFLIWTVLWFKVTLLILRWKMFYLNFFETDHKIIRENSEKFRWNPNAKKKFSGLYFLLISLI